jgi:hypothetical protein
MAAPSMRQAFDIESINLNELISTALNDPKAVSADIKAFHGINFADCLPLIRDAAHNAHRMRIISTRLDIDRIYARRRLYASPAYQNKHKAQSQGTTKPKCSPVLQRSRSTPAPKKCASIPEQVCGTRRT